MDDIPNRIWLDVSLVDSPRKTLACNLATAKRECALPTDVEFVRADPRPRVKPLELAVMFHDTYESLAPDFGYETRQETRAFDLASPNGQLMFAVASRILAALEE